MSRHPVANLRATMAKLSYNRMSLTQYKSVSNMQRRITSMNIDHYFNDYRKPSTFATIWTLWVGNNDVFSCIKTRKTLEKALDVSPQKSTEYDREKLLFAVFE